MNLSPKTVAVALGGEVSGREILAPGPNHSPKDRSLSIKLDDAAPDGFIVHSFAGDDPLQCKDHVRDKLGIPWVPKPKANGNSVQRMTDRARSPAAEYVYRQADGSPYLRVKRTPAKDFFQQHWNGNNWINGAPKGEKVPYRLPELLEAEHDTVLIVEGEKDADNLAALGLMATTNSGGAEKWSADLDQYFKGRDVFILPDNDDAGERHAAQVSSHLAQIAREIRIVRLPGLGPKQDVSDWLAAGGDVNALAALMRTAPKADDLPDLAKLDSGSSRIRLIPFDDIKISTHRRDLVKGIFPRVGLSVVWGKPKCGKSFWAYDCLMHVALDREYRGRRVHHGAVVYCAFEGQSGFEARVEAFRLHRMDGHAGAVPFYLQPVTLNLVKDHQALIKAIRDRLGDRAPVAVALDTLNRSMPGSESSDEDMSAYVKAADAIREAFENAVIIVHHCGIDGTRPRGHTSLSGAVEAQIEVKRDASDRIVVEVELAKDGPNGAQVVSTLESVVVGLDEDGEEITSCVVTPCDDAPVAATREPKLTANQKTMFTMLHDAGNSGLLTEDWNAKGRDAGIGTKRRADLIDIRTALKTKGLVREMGDRWTVNH